MSSRRGVWVRQVTSGILRSRRGGLRRVAHLWEVGGCKRRGRRVSPGTQPGEEEDEEEEDRAEGCHSSGRRL